MTGTTICLFFFFFINKYFFHFMTLKPMKLSEERCLVLIGPFICMLAFRSILMLQKLQNAGAHISL